MLITDRLTITPPYTWAEIQPVVRHIEYPAIVAVKARIADLDQQDADLDAQLDLIEFGEAYMDILLARKAISTMRTAAFDDLLALRRIEINDPTNPVLRLDGGAEERDAELSHD
jgi:hypothetical protein